MHHISKIFLKSADTRAWLLVVFSLILSVLAICGTVTSGWWVGEIWNSQFNGIYFSIFSFFLFITYFLALRFRAVFLFLILIPLAFFIGLTGFAPVTSVVWIWICAFFIGAGIRSSRVDRKLSVFNLSNAAVGFAAIGTIVGLLAHFPINVPTLYFVFFSALSIVGAFRCRQAWWRNWPVFRLHGSVCRPVSECIIGAFVLLGGTLVLAVTMLPELGYDALTYHLTLSTKMLELGFWRFDVTMYIWSVIPFGADWLFVPTYFLGGEYGARLLNSSFLLATAFAIYFLLEPRVGKLAALSAAALLLTWPISYLETTTAFIEAPLAFFFMLSLKEIVGGSKNERGTWVTLGIVAGFGCAIKLLGVLILPFLLIGAVIRALNGRFEPMRVQTLSAGIAAFLIISLQPYVVAFLRTGNPVFPFFNNIFRSPYFATVNPFGVGGGFANPLYVMPLRIRMFWDMTINSVPFGEFPAAGALGIALFVLAPVAVVASVIFRRWWVFACICSAFSYVILVFHSQAYLRYAFPALPWLFVAGGYAMAKFPRPSLSTTALVSFLCLVNLARFPVGLWSLQQFDIRMLWNRHTGAEMVLRNKPEVVVGEILSKMGVYNGEKILLLGVEPIYSAYPDGTIADSWHSWPYFESASQDRAAGKTLITTVARSGADLIVHSVGRGFAGEAELIENSIQEFRVKDVRVARVKPEIRFTHSLFSRERLVNSDVVAYRGYGWQLNGAEILPDGISVRVDSPITQRVDFKPANSNENDAAGTNFASPLFPIRHIEYSVLIEMQVSCPKGQSFRSQINWNDADGKFIATDIEVHSCENGDTEIKRISYKPHSAVSGIVYGGSHDQRPVIIKKISLRTTS